MAQKKRKASIPQAPPPSKKARQNYPIPKKLRLLRNSTNEQDFSKLWEEAAEALRDRWLAEVQRLGLRYRSSFESSIPKQERHIDLKYPSQNAKLPSLDMSASAEDVKAFIQSLISFYRDWTKPETILGGSSFFTDLQAIDLKMRMLMTPRLGGRRPLWESFVDANTQVCLQNWCQRFVHLWKTPAKQALEAEFQVTSNQVHRQGLSVLDDKFKTLVQHLEVLWCATPKEVEVKTWAKFAPKLVDDLSAAGAQIRLSHLYATYQQKMSSETERSQLGLLIWKSLKTIYFLLRTKNFQFPEDNNACYGDRFSVDKAFFANAKTLEDFEFVVGQLEAKYPALINDLTLKYCDHVSDCRQKPEEHYIQLKMLGENILSTETLSSVRQFHRTPSFDPKQNVILSHMAIRMSKLLGRDDSPFSGKAAETIALQDPLTRQSLTNGSVRPSAKGIAQFNKEISGFMNSPTCHGADPRLEWELRDENLESAVINHAQSEPIEVLTSFKPILDQITLPSAFPYVRFPFADTRATQVMESRQARGEMSTDVILSEGPRETDFINQPPRHASLSPSTVSSWGVSDFIRFGLGIRRVRPRIARIPGLQPSRNLLDPILDPKNHVRKSSLSPNQARRRAAVSTSNSSNSSSPESSPTPALTAGRTTSSTNTSGRATTPPAGYQAASAAVRQIPYGVLAHTVVFPIFEDETATTGPPAQDQEDDGSSPPTQNQPNRRRRPLFDPGIVVDPDEPVQSVEDTVEEITSSPNEPAWDGLCHRCPLFPETVHHTCNATCPNLRRRNGEIELQKLISSGPLQRNDESPDYASLTSSSNDSYQQNRSPRAASTQTDPSNDSNQENKTPDASSSPGNPTAVTSDSPAQENQQVEQVRVPLQLFTTRVPPNPPPAQVPLPAPVTPHRLNPIEVARGGFAVPISPGLADRFGPPALESRSCYALRYNGETPGLSPSFNRGKGLARTRLEDVQLDHEGYASTAKMLERKTRLDDAMTYWKRPDMVTYTKTKPGVPFPIKPDRSVTSNGFDPVGPIHMSVNPNPFATTRYNSRPTLYRAPCTRAQPGISASGVQPPHLPADSTCQCNGEPTNCCNKDCKRACSGATGPDATAVCTCGPTCGCICSDWVENPTVLEDRIWSIGGLPITTGNPGSTPYANPQRGGSDETVEDDNNETPEGGDNGPRYGGANPPPDDEPTSPERVTWADAQNLAEQNILFSVALNILDDFDNMTDGQRAAVAVLRRMVARQASPPPAPGQPIAIGPIIVNPDLTNPPPPRPSLPTRAAYEGLTRAAMIAELIHRREENTDVRRLKHADLVLRLMTLDNRGNPGRGAFGPGPRPRGPKRKRR